MKIIINTKRYYGLDALRCFAMLMGLVIHAPLVFEIPDIVGYENLRKYNPFVGMILGWIHLWRMPAFFLLSGFFAHLVLFNRGILHFLKNRILKILIPLFLFSLILNYYWNESLDKLHHLWFLYYLFIISIFSAIIFYLFNIVLRQYLIKISFQNSIIKIVFSSSLFLILIFLTSLAKENGFATKIPEGYKDISIFSLLYHWFWFILGQIFFINRRILNVRFSIKTIILFYILGTLSSFFHILLYFEILFKNFLINFFSALCSLSWIIFFVIVTNQLVKRSSKILIFFLEISYPIYLIHIFPSVIFGTIMFNLGIRSVGMIILNSILSGIFSIIIYYVFIRFTPFNWFINGYKQSWFKFF